MKQQQTLQGIVKFWNDAKGWGFLSGQDGADYFVHFTGIANKGQDHGRKKLVDGATVEFELTQGKKGIQATNVVTLEL